MYQLTISVGDTAETSRHPDWGSAQRRLIGYVIAADYYLHLTESTSAQASYQLLDLGDIDEELRCRAEGRHPRITGHATIHDVTPDSAAPSAS